MNRHAVRMTLVASLVAAAFVAPAAHADNAPLTPLMQRAFAKLEQGPDHLRWFAYRTQIIYNLSAADIIAAYEARKLAAATPPVEESRVDVASTSKR